MGEIKLKATEWQEAKQELLANYPIDTIVGALAEFIIAERDRVKVVITMEQLADFFQIKNPLETRGRKKEIVTDEDKAAQRKRYLAYQKERYRARKGEGEK